MDKYQPLRDAHTNGANYDLDTDAVIEHLKKWDAEYGISLSDIGHDRVLVQFDRLPSDLAPLASDIYAFCPDTIDQHFGCFADMVELAEETGGEVPPNVAELLEGVDLEDEDYGLVLLQRSLAASKSVALWWD